MKQNKLLALLLLSAILIVAFLSCATATEVECPHTATKRIVGKDATCTQDGYYSILCQCGKLVATQTEPIPAKGHAWMDELHVTKEATCAAEGAGYYNCKQCTELNKVTIPADASKHTDIQREVGKAATCTEDGHYSERCHGCGELVTTNAEAIPAKGHAWMDELHVTKEATCAAEGAGYYNCQNCAEVKNKTLAKDADKHTDIQREVGKAATCTEDGHYSERCHGCGELVTTNVEAIPAKGHAWMDELHVTKEATCAAEGAGYYNCRNCAEVQQFAIEKVDHDYKMPPTTIDPGTCKREGVIRYYCLNCDYTRDMTLPPDGPHNFNTQDMIVDKAPTCTDKGIGHYSCLECGESSDSKAIPAKGHDWVENTALSVAATCEKSGSTHYDCSRCDETKEEAQPALGHNWVKNASLSREPSCERPGYSSTSSCTRCDAVEREEVPALGHNDIDKLLKKGKEPTCHKDGYNYYDCERCDRIIEKITVPSLDHDWVENTTLSVPATCEEAGSTHYDCSRCDETKEEAQPALGHNWIKNTPSGRYPSCMKPGFSIIAACTRCAAEQREEIPALGHNDTDKLLKKGKEPTCHEDGYNYYDCERCDKIIEKITVPCLNPEAREFFSLLPCPEATAVMVKCTICEEVISETPIPEDQRLDHDWEEISSPQSSRRATCTTEGLQVYGCNTCRSEKTEPIPVDPDNHRMNEDSDRFVQPTCSKEGLAAWKCELCGYTKEMVLPRVTVGKHAHNYQELSEGVYTCTDCNGEFYFNDDCKHEPLEGSEQYIRTPSTWIDVPSQNACLAFARVYTCKHCKEIVVKSDDLIHIMLDPKQPMSQEKTYELGRCFACGTKNVRCLFNYAPVLSALGITEADLENNLLQ